MNRRLVPPDHSVEIPALADQVRQELGVPEVRADYHAGEWVGRQARTPWWLAIAIGNPGPIEAPDRFDRAAIVAMSLGVEWLRGNGHLLPGTLVEVSLHRINRLGPFSMSRGLGSRRRWVGDDLLLLEQPPEWLKEFEFEPCC